MRRTLQLIAGQNSSGQPVVEEVLVEETHDPRLFRLAATPGLVLGVAAGDIINVDLDAGKFEVVRRGGNISVQIFGPYHLADEIVSAVASFGGFMDGRSGGLTVLTLPFSAGFEELEHLLDSFIAKHSQVEWYYGNVYSPEDGITPLNWWNDSEKGSEI